MEPSRDEQLLDALAALRPTPRAEFAAELDARAAAGFPRRSRARRLSAMFNRLRSLKPQQLLLPAGAAAVLVLVVGVIVSQNSASTSLDSESATVSSGREGAAYGQATEERASEVAPASAGAVERYDGGSATSAAGDDYANFDSSGPQVRTGANRAIERSAQIVLGTEPEQLGRAASEVFGVVQANKGIVQRSQVSQGQRAEARFELLIPSGRMGEAMAGLSGIAAVRSRQEATADITAPTVGTAERLEDSRARIDSLLGQLAAAGSEGEREAVELELATERRRAAGLRASLANLERRAELSRVSVRIVGAEGASDADQGGAWGVDDAFDDAGRILGVAAAVSLLTLAVLAPVALLALLAWLARRAYLRRARQTALG